MSSHTISERSGDRGKSQTVDMVLIGSETGQVEFRYSNEILSANTSVFGTFPLAAMNTNYSHNHKVMTDIALLNLAHRSYPSLYYS